MADRSPFPGMDPWLERHWEDVHHSIIQYARDQLQPRLPGDLFASVEETVYIAGGEWERELYRPDLAIAESRGDRPAPAGGSGVAVAAEPVRVRLPDRRITQGHIEIRQLREGNPLVTVVEVISPVNKLNGKGRRKYLEKRDTYEQAEVNLVEIDLLRAGPRLVDLPPEVFEESPHLDTAYKCSVRRAHLEGEAWADFYPMPLRQPLPRIAIPLRATDEDVALDLQALIDLAYVNGRYGLRLDYDKPPEPPLAADDAAWAHELLSHR